MAAVMLDLPDIHACVAGSGYHLVGLTFHLPQTPKFAVRGDNLTVDFPDAFLTPTRFLAELGCRDAIGPTEGAHALSRFTLRYTGDVRRTTPPCVSRSRTLYTKFMSDGFGIHAIVVEPTIQDQVWQALDDQAIARVTGTARDQMVARSPRCADWAPSP